MFPLSYDVIWRSRYIGHRISPPWGMNGRFEHIPAPQLSGMDVGFGSGPEIQFARFMGGRESGYSLTETNEVAK